MKKHIEEIKEQWVSKNIDLNSGASLNLIIEAEKLIGFTFPDDFKELYLEVNGFSNFDWRENMFSIWPLEKIVEEYNLSEDKNFIGFVDYLIHSHSLGFVKNKPGIFKMYIDNNYIPIAASFIEAIRLINKNSDLIY